MSLRRSDRIRPASPWPARHFLRRSFELTLVDRRPIGNTAIRLTLSGFALESFRYQGGDQRCTLRVPWPDDEAWRYMVPAIADPWSAALQWSFAAALARPLRRRLTISGFRGEALEIDFDVVLHGESPLGSWAQSTSLGTAVDVVDNGRRYHVPDTARSQLLIADESGAAAALAVAAETPPSVPTTLYVPRTVAETGVRGSGEHVTVIAVPADHRSDEAGHVFAETVLTHRPVLLPDLVGIAGERSFAHTLVRSLRRAGVPRGAIHAGAYWKRQ